ncbi:MAG TPA: hypothetical protein VII06_02725 [Chloroflexota bacterium]|jgi:hypothetical protein
MGYSLYWENQPDDVRTAVLKHPDIVQEARESGENPWHAAFIPEVLGLMREHGSCRHWNITGMAYLRGIMRELGMMHDEAPLPEPTPAHYDVPRTATGRDDTASPQWQQYTRALGEWFDALRTYRFTTPGIPIHKLSSNGAWLVTVEELDGALAAAERAAAPHQPMSSESKVRQPPRKDLTSGKWLPREDIQDVLKAATGAEFPDPLWDDWLEFLRDAREHGGFRVY